MSVAAAEFVELTVGGLDCPSCAATIERHLRQLGGVTTCQGNFAAGRGGVEYLPDRIGISQLEQALERLGYPVQRRRAPQEHAQFWTPERRHLITTVIAGLLI